MVTAVRFLNGQEVLSLSTAAQNIHVFRRKSPLHKKHFFEWLKTANFSTACGTSTLKSPPSRAFAAPHVHPRPRKRLARCTLDCGFKTPESPELRGFVAGPWALATAALYLAFFFVLEKGSKSAGNAVIPTFPAHCPHGLQHLRHKRPTLAFSGENGYTLGFAQRIAHSGLHAETGGVSDGGGITTLGAFRTFTNIPGPGIRTASFAAFGAWSGVLPKNAESLRDSDALMRVAVPRRRGPAGLRDLFRFCRNRDLYIRRSWFSACARHGWYHYPRTVSHVSETLRGRVSERRALPLLGLGRVCSQRTQKAFGTAMRLCASLSRGVAAPLGCVIFFHFCRNCDLYAIRACAR